MSDVARRLSCRKKDLIIVKLGGSSITDKAREETLNAEALDWFSNALALAVDKTFLAPDRATTAVSTIPTCSMSNTFSGNEIEKKASFIIVHGAGSFGHHTAREFGLRGQFSAPSVSDDIGDSAGVSGDERRRVMQGLAKTRRSVLKLNGEVVSSLIEKGINAVGISPFSVPHMQAHGGNEGGGTAGLVTAIGNALRAGLIPVIHGDACLYGRFGAGILGGDTLVKVIGTDASLSVSKAIFLTDVEGVFTSDPNLDRDAELLNSIEIDAMTGKVVTDLKASGSTHEHDVTGGLETKLGAAVTVARSGVDVLIVKHGSISAKQAILCEGQIDVGTIVRVTNRI